MKQRILERIRECIRTGHFEMTFHANKKNKRIAGGDACEYCAGTVREHIAEREVFRHKHGLVILEHVPIGVCDKCGERYYSAEVLRKVRSAAFKPQPKELSIDN